MFASIELALRIETASARLSRTVALATPREPGAPAPFALPIGPGFAVFSKAGAPTNKVIGAGIDAPLDEAELSRLEQAFGARGEDVRFELSTLARIDAGERLSARGYRLRGFENVLAVELAGAPHRAQAPGIGIERAANDALQPWLGTLVDGFVCPDDSGVPGESFPRAILEEMSRDFSRAPGVCRYVARIEGQPVGAASMRLDGRVAELCGAATLPAFRRRGVQQALFQRRLDDARAAGCEVAVVNTAPGTQSQSNAERRGFRLLYARAILVRPAASLAAGDGPGAR